MASQDGTRFPPGSGTGMGSPRFFTTRWTVVLEAGGDGPERDRAMQQFAQSYWYPVYAFIRRRGNDAEAARDLTQGFFEQMLEKNWLAGVERGQTRFSTLLLTILSNFLVSEHRRATRECRGSGRQPISLDLASAEQWFGGEPRTEETPERMFERRIALTVLRTALQCLGDEMRQSGRGRQFEVLSPFLSREPEKGQYAEAGEALGLSTNAVAAAVLRLRREYREHVRAEVASGLTDPRQAEEEMRHLARALT